MQWEIFNNVKILQLKAIVSTIIFKYKFLIIILNIILLFKYNKYNLNTNYL